MSKLPDKCLLVSLEMFKPGALETLIPKVYKILKTELQKYYDTPITLVDTSVYYFSPNEPIYKYEFFTQHSSLSPKQPFHQIKITCGIGVLGDIIRTIAVDPLKYVCLDKSKIYELIKIANNKVIQSQLMLYYTQMCNYYLYDCRIPEILRGITANGSTVHNDKFDKYNEESAKRILLINDIMIDLYNNPIWENYCQNFAPYLSFETVACSHLTQYADDGAVSVINRNIDDIAYNVASLVISTYLNKHISLVPPDAKEGDE